MQAFLPKNLERSSLIDLPDGEIGYCVPWAMYAMLDGSLWLDGDYSFRHSPGNAATMQVEKCDGRYIVDISGCKDERWGRGDSSHTNGIPVSELKFDLSENGGKIPTRKQMR